MVFSELGAGLPFQKASSSWDMTIFVLIGTLKGLFLLNNNDNENYDKRDPLKPYLLSDRGSAILTVPPKKTGLVIFL